MDKWWIGGHADYGCELENDYSYLHIAFISVFPIFPLVDFTATRQSGRLRLKFANSYLFEHSYQKQIKPLTVRSVEGLVDAMLFAQVSSRMQRREHRCKVLQAAPGIFTPSRGEYL